MVFLPTDDDENSAAALSALAQAMQVRGEVFLDLLKRWGVVFFDLQYRRTMFYPLAQAMQVSEEVFLDLHT
jgi:hypothetical protein